MQHVKLSKVDNYCIRVDKGQDVIQAITEFCNINKITFASFCGIGATNDAVVSIYNTKTKKYEDRKIKQDAEILSLNGNVSLFENKPFVHAHVVLGINKNSRPNDWETILSLGLGDFMVVGGHVKECKISLTCEIFLTQYNDKIKRIPDDTHSISVLKLKNIIH